MYERIGFCVLHHTWTQSLVFELVLKSAHMHAGVSCMQALAHSPQFQQQLATFGGALQTGQLDLAQFGLQAEVRGAAHLELTRLGGAMSVLGFRVCLL